MLSGNRYEQQAGDMRLGGMRLGGMRLGGMRFGNRYEAAGFNNSKRRSGDIPRRHTGPDQAEKKASGMRSGNRNKAGNRDKAGNMKATGKERKTRAERLRRKKDEIAPKIKKYEGTKNRRRS